MGEPGPKVSVCYLNIYIVFIPSILRDTLFLRPYLTPLQGEPGAPGLSGLPGLPGEDGAPGQKVVIAGQMSIIPVT